MADVHWGTVSLPDGLFNPSILFLGDSWFWYPKGNLPRAIHRHFSEHDFLVIGRNGSEAAQWKTKYRKDIKGTFKLYAASSRALFLSGGGNDVAGSDDFLKIIRRDCSGARSVQECYPDVQPEAILESIVTAYRQVIEQYRQHNQQATVFLHNYDNAWPTGEGFWGPADWLKTPMDKAKVPGDLRRDLFKNLLAQLHQAQAALAQDPSLGPVVAIPSAGTMPEDSVDKWWDNELHPTVRGFELIADRQLVPALKQAVMA